MLEVEKIAAELIKHCQQQIHQQKNSIINNLKLSERNLVKNIKQNPKRWNSEFLDIKLDKAKPDNINVGLSALIKVNHPDAPSDAGDKSESSSQQHNQNIRELIEKMRKEQDEAMWHEAMRQEKRRNETRRERQEREWRDHGMRFHATPPPPPEPPRPDCKTQ